MTCLIVDDEPLARKLLATHIAKVPDLELVASLGSPLAALDHLRESPPDILFLDVQMPELTGTGLLKILGPTHPTNVILSTAYSDYALEGYDLNITDYLLKPITFERFLQAVEKVRNPAKTVQLSKTASPADHFFVKDGLVNVRINLAELRCVESMGDYVRLHLPDRRVTTLSTMKAMLKRLPATDFVRIHHGWIVGVRHVEEVHRDEVRVAGELLPVSQTYRGALAKLLE